MKQPIYDESLDVKWDDGTYGVSEEHAKRADLDNEFMAEFEKSAAMTLISIRLQDDLINDLKEIAAIHGLGYQPMIRQLLKRFVKAERKVLAARNSAMNIQVDTNSALSDDGNKKTVTA
ncbi:hypothetical protein Q3O60_08295 [Alkalimonas collagenimarina]|uniref:CopG family transcriptional regulator n=1 Tax=Alkalimonas collagenimarina TaxID=400390 RepID=A0ABT9GZ92_9GAMM|nr:hypothetical protein [Alkalimonas collagenimarina]MDP4536184.1 hypothetical protein [Alkalimonas collagenimarina]